MSAEFDPLLGQLRTRDTTLIPGEPSGAIIYVTPSGSDSNSGSSWGEPMATIPSAIAALPANGGVVQLGYGSWSVSSSSRTDSSVSYTGSGSSYTWTDTSITSGDVGSYVIGANINGRSPKIVSVTASNGFVTDIAPGGSIVSQSLTIVKPAIVLPDGVTLQGISSATGTAGSIVAGSSITDSGSGITIFIRGGAGISFYWGRTKVKDVAIWGNTNGAVGGTTLYGVFVNNNDSFVEITDCDISGHGTFAFATDYNNNSLDCHNTTFNNSGSSAATSYSGGVGIEVYNDYDSANVNFYNCGFYGNYGWGICGPSFGGATATTLIGCQFATTHTTSASRSGTAMSLSSGGLGSSAVVNCYSESSATRDLYVLTGQIPVVGTQFDSNCAYAVEANVSGSFPGQVNLMGIYSANHTSAFMFLNTGALATWNGCTISESSFFSGGPTPSEAAGIGSWGAPINTNTNSVFSGVGSFPATGAITTNDITVLPASAVSGSASMFLNNNAGQVWEFFSSSSGQFGVYDKTNSLQPLTINPNSPSNSILVNNGNVSFGQDIQMNSHVINNVASINPAADNTGSLGLSSFSYATGYINKLVMETGTNKAAGTGTLSAGTVTISTTAVTSNSLIFLTDTNSSLTNVGNLSVTSKIAGTGFTVTSSNNLDTSTFNWLIIN